MIITDLLESEGLVLPDVCSVNIYMRDMEDYAMLNEVYVDTFSFTNPPTRVCVQCPLPKNVGLIMDAVSFIGVFSRHLKGGILNLVVLYVHVIRYLSVKQFA